MKCSRGGFLGNSPLPTDSRAEALDHGQLKTSHSEVGGR
jgi:hypothetical protein